MDGGEEMETLYRATFEKDDENKTAAGIVREWCEAIAGGESDD